uniref:Uncharacterized protein n=1 Tax=Rhizophora mucronata TaxID=61149 RepID=A0A2P2NPI9_RHIMU
MHTYLCILICFQIDLKQYFLWHKLFTFQSTFFFCSELI